jgi:hypothetical protein
MEQTNGEHDFPLNDLLSNIDVKTRHALSLLNDSRQPWLNSLAYCTLFEPRNPATRVFFRLENDVPQDVLFYRLVKKMGFLTLEIEGFPTTSDAIIKTLLQRHKADLAIVNRLESPVKPDEEAQISAKHIYLKSYVTVAPLPDSKEMYLTLLGKNKKKQLPQYLRRLQRHFEDKIEFRVQLRDEILVEEAIQLELLNRDRRATLGKGVDSVQEIETRQQNLMPLIEAAGCMLTVRHEGKILGGTLSFLHGNKAFMLVTGHDAANDNLRIGHLGIWKTLEYFIDNGIDTCNFLWGRKLYKTQFLGVEYPWTVHIIDSAVDTHGRVYLLARFWKHYIGLYEFYLRGERFIKTRLGL